MAVSHVTCLVVLAAVAAVSGQTTGTIATVAGNSYSGSADGTGRAASFAKPWGIAMDALGSFALTTEYDNHDVRRINVSTYAVSPLCGSPLTTGSSNGVGTNAKFYYPLGIAMDATGSVALVADSVNQQIRRIDVSTGAVTVLAGQTTNGNANGVGTNATFYYPSGIALNAPGTVALVADSFNHIIRRINVTSGVVSTIAGSPTGITGSADGVGTLATFNYPRSITMDASVTFALVGDRTNALIRRINLTSGAVTTVAGQAGSTGTADGVGTLARFNAPEAIVLEPASSFALIADTANRVIRRFNVSSGAVATLAGSGVQGSADGAAASASFNFITGLAILYPTNATTSASGAFALVADSYNHIIRSVILVPPSFSSTSTGTPSTTSSPSGTGTPSATLTLSTTQTVSASQMQSTTQSSTPSMTVSNSQTQTRSPSPTQTRSGSQSGSPTFTPSMTSSPASGLNPRLYSGVATPNTCARGLRTMYAFGPSGTLTAREGVSDSSVGMSRSVMLPLADSVYFGFFGTNYSMIAVDAYGGGLIFRPDGGSGGWSSTWTDDYSDYTTFPIYGVDGPPFAGIFGRYTSIVGSNTELPGYPAQNAVYYRVSSSGGPDSARMSHDVAAAFPREPPFSPSSIIVVTWFAVAEDSAPPERVNRRSTFQVVLATDPSNRTFSTLCFDNLVYPGGVGFNSGDGIHYYSLPGSPSINVTALPCGGSGGVSNGCYTYRVDGVNVTLPSATPTQSPSPSLTPSGTQTPSGAMTSSITASQRASSTPSESMVIPSASSTTTPAPVSSTAPTPSPSPLPVQVSFTLYVSDVSASSITAAGPGGLLRLSIACYTDVPLGSVLILSVTPIRGAALGAAILLDASAPANVQIGTCDALRAPARTLRASDPTPSSFSPRMLATLPTTGVAADVAIKLWNITAAQQATVARVIAALQALLADSPAAQSTVASVAGGGNATGTNSSALGRLLGGFVNASAAASGLASSAVISLSGANLVSTSAPAATPGGGASGASEPSSGVSAGTIAGIAIALIVVLVAVGVGVFLYCRNSSRAANPIKHDPSVPATSAAPENGDPGFVNPMSVKKAAGSGA